MTASDGAWSQNAAPVELPPVQVQGDQVGQSVKTAYEVRHASPNSKVVIEGEQLNQFNDLSVGDAIRRLPGVTFPGVNRSREIKLRGLPGVYTRVLIDGRPLIDGDSGRNMEVDRIPASFIERVEIIRNPLASSDSQGAAGTVNIITRRNFGVSGGGVTLGGGYVQNYQTTGEGSVWQGGQAGKLKYFIGGGYQRRLLEESIDTYALRGFANKDGSNLQDQKRKFDEYTVLGRFEYDLDAFNRFIVAPTFLRTEETRTQHDLTYFATPNPAIMYRDTVEVRNRARQNYGSYLEWAHDFSAATQMRLFFDVQKASETTLRNSTRYEYKNTGVLDKVSNPNLNNYVPIDLHRYAPGLAFTSQIGAHKLEYGAGLNRLTREETTPGNAGRTYKIGENVFYGYLSDSFGVIGSGDLLTVGVRAEQSSTDTTDNLGITRSRTATDLNPSVQYRLPLAGNTDLRLGVSRTLRRPDLRDLTPTITAGDGTYAKPDTQGNPDLLPERIWGFDGGIDLFLFDRSGLLAFNVFRRNFQDKIETQIANVGGRYLSSSRNAGDGHLEGAEIESRVPLAFLGVPNLTLWGNLTALRSELTDPLTQQTRPFAEQPRLLSNIGLDYYIPQWRTTIGVNANRVFSYDDDILSFTGGTLPPAAPVLQRTRTQFNTLDKLDLSIRTQVAPNWTVTFAALNLLRPIDRRTITITPVGGTETQQMTAQASHSTYYVRTSYTW